MSPTRPASYEALSLVPDPALVEADRERPRRSPRPVHLGRLEPAFADALLRTGAAIFDPARDAGTGRGRADGRGAGLDRGRRPPVRARAADVGCGTGARPPLGGAGAAVVRTGGCERAGDERGDAPPPARGGGHLAQRPARRGADGRRRWLLLQATDKPVAEIALDVGYGSPSRFAGRFRKRFGHPPHAVRDGDPES